MCTLFLVLSVFSVANVEAIEIQTIMPLEDTYIVVTSPLDPSHGLDNFLRVAHTKTELSLAHLMFDLSEVLQRSNASLEAKLRLRSIYVPSPHVIGVRWCVNNTWDEDTFTPLNATGFFMTAPESFVNVTSKYVWYEWGVTDFVRTAIRENYEKITLVLESEEVEGNAFVMFYSKDQEDLQSKEYSPKLVFTYNGYGGVSLDIAGKVIFGVLATVGISFIAYRFLKKPAKKRRRSSSVKQIREISIIVST